MNENRKQEIITASIELLESAPPYLEKEVEWIADKVAEQFAKEQKADLIKTNKRLKKKPKFDFNRFKSVFEFIDAKRITSISNPEQLQDEWRIYCNKYLKS